MKSEIMCGDAGPLVSEAVCGSELADETRRTVFVEPSLSGRKLFAVVSTVPVVPPAEMACWEG